MAVFLISLLVISNGCVQSSIDLDDRKLEALAEVPLWLGDYKKHYVRSIGFGYASTEWLPQYIKALNSSNEDSVYLSLICLGRLGIHSKEALPIVLTKIDHTKNAIKIAAIKCCGDIGIHDDVVLNRLRKLTLDTDSLVSIAAIEAAGKIDLPLLEDYKLLKKHFKSNNFVLSSAAIKAIRSLRHRIATYILHDVFSTDEFDRLIAIKSLENMDNFYFRISAYICCLISLQDSSSVVRANAIECLASNSLLRKLEFQMYSYIRKRCQSESDKCSAVRAMLSFENSLDDGELVDIARAMTDESPDVRLCASLLYNCVSRRKDRICPLTIKELLVQTYDNRVDVRDRAFGVLNLFLSDNSFICLHYSFVILFGNDLYKKFEIAYSVGRYFVDR